MKLVRDKQPDLLPHLKVRYGRAGARERRPLLLAKLLEEAGELVAAQDSEEALKELGDLQEIIWAIGQTYDLSREKVMLQAYGKLDERGGFDDLRTMECVESAPATPEARQSPVSRFDIGGGAGYSG